LTLRYIPTTTLVKNEEHDNILLRGNPAPQINNRYVQRPTFVVGEHMPFQGWQAWQ